MAMRHTHAIDTSINTSQPMVANLCPILLLDFSWVYRVLRHITLPLFQIAKTYDR